MGAKFYTRRHAEAQEGCGFSFLRFLLIIANVIMLLLSLAVVIVVIIAVTDANEYLHEHCNACRNSWIVTVACCSFLCVATLLGFAALCSRNRCLLILYSILMLTMMCVFGAVTVFVALVRTNTLDSELASAWSDLPADTRCRVELKYECSGWDLLCNATSASSGPNGTSIVVGCAACSNPNSTITIGNFTETCKTKFQDEVQRYFPAMIAIAATATFMALLSAFAACRMQGMQKISDEEQLLNEHYV